MNIALVRLYNENSKWPNKQHFRKGKKAPLNLSFLYLERISRRPLVMSVGSVIYETVWTDRQTVGLRHFQKL